MMIDRTTTPTAAKTRLATAIPSAVVSGKR